MSDVNQPELIALIKCEQKDPEFRKRYQPMWIQLLAGSGEYQLTTHREFAWITGFHRAEEVIRDLNRDPDWNAITYNLGSMQSSPIPVIYSMVEFMEYKWQSMDNAPTDCVILTDVGVVIGIDRPNEENSFTTNWYLCDSKGNFPVNTKGGAYISPVRPIQWMPMPPLERV